MAVKKKMSHEYSYISDAEHGVATTLLVGQVVEGETLKFVKARHPEYLINVEDEVEEEDDAGRIKDLRLTAPEKASKPKDEDPKDPDKSKDAIKPVKA